MLEDKLAELPKMQEKMHYLDSLVDIQVLLDQNKQAEKETTAENFWDNPAHAQKVMKNITRRQQKIERHKLLTQRLADLQVIADIVAGTDTSEAEKESFSSEFADTARQLEQYELDLILNGKYDADNAIFSLAAGAGGTDAQDWAQIMLRMYQRWFERQGYKYQLVDYSPGEEAGLKGATMLVQGDYAYGYCKAESGIHRLVRLSPFNANNKRQTSFAAVEVAPEVDLDLSLEIKQDELRVDTYRASGAGGQHVNRTDSAVRLTHLPSGIVVQCQNERSQLQNKETAMRILAGKLAQRLELEHKDKISEIKGENKDIAWGNQIRSYVFHPYSLVKDHRTGIETANVQAVLDGDLEAFVSAYLRQGGKDGNSK